MNKTKGVVKVHVAGRTTGVKVFVEDPPKIEEGPIFVDGAAATKGTKGGTQIRLKGVNFGGDKATMKLTVGGIVACGTGSTLFPVCCSTTSDCYIPEDCGRSIGGTTQPKCMVTFKAPPGQGTGLAIVLYKGDTASREDGILFSYDAPDLNDVDGARLPPRGTDGTGEGGEVLVR